MQTKGYPESLALSFVGRLALTIAWLSALGGLILVMSFGGWALLSSLGFLLFVTIAHIVVCNAEIRDARPGDQRPHKAVLIASVLVFAGCLLQWDVGREYDWLVITALFGGGPGALEALPPDWFQGWSGKYGHYSMVSWNHSVFIPTLISWFFFRAPYGHKLSLIGFVWPALWFGVFSGVPGLLSGVIGYGGWSAVLATQLGLMALISLVVLLTSRLISRR